MRNTASAIESVFTSNAMQRRYESPANITDVIADLAKATRTVADAIKPTAVAPGEDASGTTVDSLTEAVMGITSGLYAIASSIGDLADAIREKE